MSSLTFDNGSRRSEIAVTVDAVILTSRAGKPMVVMVRRGNEPFLGSWALPGGFVETDEDLPDAASRELREETGLTIPTRSLIQLGAYGRPGRDPRMRVVSIAYWLYLADLDEPEGGNDAATSRLIPLDQTLAEDFDLAFDHNQIVRDAVRAARERGWPV